MSHAECGKGWSGRCAAAKSKKCQCSCGGENHGKARPVFTVTVDAELLDTIVQGCILIPRTVEQFEYEGAFGKRALTHLTIAGKVIIATERDDNPGMSITNAAENLWEKVRERFGADIIAIERYPERGPRNGRLKESLSLVTMVNGTATWTPLSREALVDLINGPIAPLSQAVA
jgi:hypothetical protein